MVNGNISLNEVKAKAAEMFVYFSLILGKGVRTSDGVFLGNVWDVSAKLGEVYPKSEELIIYKGFFNRTYASIPWPGVVDIEDDIVVSAASGAPSFAPGIKEYEFLLRRDVLDQQVVDTFNHKVRRVNDMHLLKVDRDLVIAHVDIGLRGLVRRLGWQKPVDFIVKLINPRAVYLREHEIVSWKNVQPITINPASMTMKLSVSEKQMLSIPAADLGEIIFDLNPTQRMAIFRSMDVRTKAKVFEHLDFDDQKIILKELDKKEAAQIVGIMSSDEAADLLERLPQATVRNLLTMIESGRAKKLSGLLGYSSDSAGGLMTTEYVALPETTTVESAIEHVKNQTKEFDNVPYIYIVDDKNRLKGATTVRRLLFADPKDAITRTAFPKTLSVFLNNSVREVAYFMDKYRMSAIPVVDENRILHGIVTMDDILSQVISIAWRKRPRVPKEL
jgi:CBS domain-containing protein